MAWTIHNLEVEGVIFDMDGVIVDTLEAHVASWGEFLRREGIDRDGRSFVMETFGRGNSEVLGSMFPHIQDPAILEAKSDAKEALFVEALLGGAAPLMPGIHDWLEQLKAENVPTAVATSAPRRNMDAVLDYFNIREFFQAFASGDEVVKSKPAPDIFLLAAERLAIPANRTLVYEDSMHGIRSATAAGAAVAGVASTHSFEELLPHCHVVIGDFTGETLSRASAR